MKKSKWLFNIMTVVLCVCAMAIGVYAAKQASVTVNGQIGFEAHNCKIQVSGTVDAYNQEGDTKLSGDSATLPTTIVDGKAETVTFPTAIYFSDIKEGGDNIYLNLTVKNLSEFAVDCTVNTPVFKLGTTVSTMVTSAVSKTSFTLASGADTPVKITFTLPNIQSVTDITTGKYELFMEFTKTLPGVDTNLQISNLLDTKTNQKTSLEVLNKTNCKEELDTSAVKLENMTPYKENNIVQDISITATIKNNSSKKAYVEISAPTGLSDQVSLSTKQQYITLPFKTYIDKNSSKTVTFALTTGTEQIEINSLSINISAKEDTGNHSTLFQYEENFDVNGDGTKDGYWYATMGVNPYSGYNEPLKWLPIAEYNGTAVTGDENDKEGTTSADYHKFAYTTNCPKVGSSYYLMSQYLLDVTSNQTGMFYATRDVNSNCAAYLGGNVWLAMNGVPSHDYSVSNVRAYLTGTKDSYYNYSMTRIDDSVIYVGDTSTKLNAFTSTNNPFDIASGALYTSIIKRTQASLYKEMKMDWSSTAGADNSTAFPANSFTKDTDADLFWLLSVYEIDNFIGANTSAERASRIAYKLSDASTADEWWFRSVRRFASDASIDTGGYIDDVNGIHMPFGVRPAIQVVCKV